MHFACSVRRRLKVFSTLSALSKTMSRRAHSESPIPRSPKRTKIDHLTKDSFKDALVLAPMVRSGALPTRLFALKHGATLVWAPETVDKAILHAERVVDPVTGVVSYNGKSRAIWATHPIEKPYLIYQIGSADPELAVKAAKTVQQDVSGFDLNCGCPKPFSTHAGMGAALLTNPDLLCSILTALRETMPPEITVTAKIRLLPSQEDTLELVERIVNTGISALTVHCRTRNMREKDKAVIERLREIVDFVKGMGKDIAVIENGDCLGAKDVKRVRDTTGAHSVMIARAAESNPSCFSSAPLTDIHETLIPSYLRLSRYLDNHWSLTKFCISQFKGTHTRPDGKAEDKRVRETVVKSRSYDDVTEIAGSWTGEEDFKEIVRAIETRPPKEHTRFEPESADAEVTLDSEPTLTQFNVGETPTVVITPTGTQNPEPPGSGAPLVADVSRTVPSLIAGQDPLTPTPASAAGMAAAISV